MIRRSAIDEFLWALSLAHRAMRATVQRALLGCGIHGGQQFLLESLWREDDITCGELARRLGVALPTVTKAVTRMETAGVVVRRQGERDARLVHVSLTLRGRQLERDVQARLRTVVEAALEGVTAEERARALEVLWRVSSNLRPGAWSVEPLRAPTSDEALHSD